jgi:hypothetical protein
MKKVEKIKKLSNDKQIQILSLICVFAWSVAWQLYYGEEGGMPTFIITLAAVIAAALTIWKQHEAGIKQETVGAWQILANRAAGNSGKIEAIQFLAKQKLSLAGMSKEHNGGQVYLNRLDVSEKTSGFKVDLSGAQFEGADLSEAHFEGCYIAGVWNKEVKADDLPKTAPSDPFKFEFDTERKPEPALDKDGKPTEFTKHFIRLVNCGGGG